MGLGHGPDTQTGLVHPTLKARMTAPTHTYRTEGFGRPAKTQRQAPQQPTNTRAQQRPVAVVIGSGFGGLAAAIRLSVKGYEVKILEKLDAPGGRETVALIEAALSRPLAIVLLALALVLLGKAAGFADVSDGADNARDTAVGQSHRGLADDDMAFRAIRGDDCGFVALHMVRMQQQLAFLRGVTRGGFGIEQVVRGLADPVFARAAGEALPGAIEQHEAALRILAEDRAGRAAGSRSPRAGSSPAAAPASPA